MGKVARASVHYRPRPTSSGEMRNARVDFRAWQIDSRDYSTAPVGRHDGFTLEVPSRGRRGGDEVTRRTKTLYFWSQRKQTDHDVYIWSKHRGRRIATSRRTTRTVPQHRPFVKTPGSWSWSTRGPVQHVSIASINVNHLR